MVWMQVVVEVSSNRRLADSPGDLLKVVEVEDVPQEASGLLEVEEVQQQVVACFPSQICMKNHLDWPQYQHLHGCVVLAFLQQKGPRVGLLVMLTAHPIPILLHCCFVIYWRQLVTVREAQGQPEASWLQGLVVQHQQGVPQNSPQTL